MTTILIVDDEREVVLRLRPLLTDLGYASKFVMNPQKLVTFLEATPIDLILLDINMPGVDGITVLKELKAHPTHHAIPVMMMTGETNEQALAECFENGAIDYVNKPIHEPSLKARIKSAITTKNYADSLRQNIESRREINQKLETEMKIRSQVEEILDENRRTLLGLMGHLHGMAYRREDVEEWALSFVSEGALELTGYSPSELLENLKHSYAELIVPESRNMVKETIQQSVQSQTDFELSYQITTATGKKWVLDKGEPIFSLKGKLSYVEGFVTDITEQKLAEEQLRQVSKELEKLNLDKDKFFSIISHDLRTPLIGLLGFSEMLKNDAETYPREKIKKFAENIHASAKRLHNLLENMLRWGRIQTGKVKYQPMMINLRSIADENVKLFEGNAMQKGIRIFSTIEENVMSYGDKDMVDSTIRNLVSNAIKFTKQGGEVKLSAKNKEGKIEVAVSDTGVGMTQEAVGQLFRVDVPHTTRGTNDESGTGLGLMICKELIEKNGGNIWVESEVNQGSTFRFTIPLKPANE